VQMVMGSSLWDLAFRPDPFTKLTNFGHDLAEKRSRKVSAEDWDKFVAQTKTEFEPIVTRLQKSASVINRQDQQMLFASRDCLPKMLKDSREEVSAAERKFTQHLKNVEFLRNGRDLFGGNLRRRFPGVSRAIGSFSTTEIAGAAFVLVDIAVVLWLVRMWRGRPKGTAT